MSSNKKILFTIIILILFSLAAQAGDFSFTQGKGVDSICPRATGLFTDVIKNSGEEQQFTVNVEGSAAVWSTAVPSGFNLLPAEEKTVYTYVTPFETAQPGNYEVGVVVTTANSVKKLSHPVVIKECYDASLSVVQVAKNVCPNDKAIAFEAVVTNLGEYQENYAVSVEGAVADWVTLSEENVNIEKGGSKSVFAYVDIPEDALGEKEFTIVVKGLSRGSDTVKSVTYKINIQPCYEFDIAPQQNTYSMCEASTQNIPIAIKNKGTIENSYSLSINGPEWASLSKTSVSLEPGQSEVINIILNPGYKIEGKSTIDLEVVPVKGFLKALDSFEIEVRKCHSVQLDILRDEDKLCNDVLNTYDVIVSNDGEVNKQYKLESEGDWKWLDQDSISLNAGEKKTIVLSVKPSVDASPGTNTIKVRAVALDESGVSAEDEIKITNVNIEKCYEPELIIIPDDVVVYYDSVATIPVQVKNRGERQAKYELGVSDSAVNFVQLSPSAITVDPADTKVVNLYIAPAAQVVPKQYEAVVAVRLSDTTLLASKKVKIRVTENKEEATIGLTGAVVGFPDGGELTLWQRLKNWIKSLFAKEEVAEPSVEEVPIEPSAEAPPQEAPVENVSEEAPVEEAPPAEAPPAETPSEAPPTLAGCEELTIVRREMGEGDVYLFGLKNEQHSVKIEKIEENKTIFTFSSDPISVELNVGEIKEVDIDGDGVNDVRVTLNGYTESGKADITYEVIEGEEEAAPSEGEEAGATSKLWGEILNYKYYILAGVVILIVIILISKTNFHKKIVEFFEEDIEEEEKVEEKKEEVKEEKKEKKKKE